MLPYFFGDIAIVILSACASLSSSVNTMPGVMIFQGQQPGLSLASVKDVERNSTPAECGQRIRDFRAAIGPIRFEWNDSKILKAPLYFSGAEDQPHFR